MIRIFYDMLSGMDSGGEDYAVDKPRIEFLLKKAVATLHIEHIISDEEVIDLYKRIDDWKDKPVFI